MIIRQHFHPFWYEELNLTYRKFIQYIGKDSGDIFFSQLFAVGCHGRHTIFILQISDKFLRFFFIWHLGVYKNQKWFALFFQKVYSQCLCISEIFSWKFAEASICRNHQSDRCMFLNDFACASLCCFMKRNRFFKPWSFYHAFSSVFDVAAGIFYEESHTVDQPDPHFLVIT